ncbi:MAG: hypothetical protein HY074_15790 [Deltaproteobacteria bacterium]|nr:hypothetical protein [Deltaproteobacteria bacterium]
MKKTRIIMLLMSLFALTPAFLGAAWGAEDRSKHGEKQECQLMTAKRLKAEADAKVQEKKSGSRTSID